MKIKRFHAPDMRQAIRMVRDDVGPDAVILSTRNTGGGVEIVAAIDYDAELVDRMVGDGHTESRDEQAAAPAQASAPLDPAPERPEPEHDRNDEQRPAWKEHIAARPAQVRDGPAPQPQPQPQPRPATSRVEWVQDPALSAMQEELKSLRAILQDQMARLATSDYDRREPVRAEIGRRLSKAGFDESVARGIAAGTTDLATLGDAWQEALFGLARRLPVAPVEQIEQSRIIALVGATGVGKTTTAAKLAARACLRYGSKSVALISTDDYRVGAQRQLASFGLLLGLPVRQARSTSELADHLAEFANRRQVIIDTAGMSQRDLRLLEESRKLGELGNVENYLVMSANVQREVMDEVIDAFGRERLAGCILTKLDEAARLGPALSTVLTRQLPVAFVSEGQRVPEDLRPARARDLIASALAQRTSQAAPPQAAPTVAAPAREVLHASA